MEKSELLEHLRKAFGAAYDEWDAEAALYWFCANWHSGQWSDLYAILSQSRFQPGCLHRGVEDEGDLAAEMYSELVAFCKFEAEVS